MPLLLCAGDYGPGGFDTGGRASKILIILSAFVTAHRLRAHMFRWSKAIWGPAFVDEARPLEDLLVQMEQGHLRAHVC